MLPRPSTGCPSGLQLPTFWDISWARTVTHDWLSGTPPSTGLWHTHKHILTSQGYVFIQQTCSCKVKIIQKCPTHRLLVVFVISGGGRALLSPGPPSWEGVGGSTRWNSNGVRFCVRYTTWPSPAIRQTDREMGRGNKGRAWREGIERGGCRLKRDRANGRMEEGWMQEQRMPSS